MTLIAQLSIHGAPILIGDVLKSKERRTGLKVNLPLVGDVNQILADNGLLFEVDFAQKSMFSTDALLWHGVARRSKQRGLCKPLQISLPDQV